MASHARPAISLDDRLIVALDTPLGAPNALAGAAMADRLGDAVGFYKIGLGMLASGGMALAIELKDRLGARIFMDLKLYDIGQTVENAVRGLVAYDLDLLTVHGDPPVVRAAVEGRGAAQTKILAITVLTSLDRADLDAMQVRDGAIEDIAVERARLALAAGADGVVSSPREAAAIRALPEAAGRLIVTPGVRPEALSPGAGDDQKRVARPAQAIADGADHLVVGRPVIAAEDPRAAALAVRAEIAAALRSDA